MIESGNKDARRDNTSFALTILSIPSLNFVYSQTSFSFNNGPEVALNWPVIEDIRAASDAFEKLL
jgi:hypothetical protein